ncbi:GlsB/YeaQ/YmgE family stress response membrane protein [Mycobacterium sp.]|uniref:GlsB/YeaQ/YmgE family stress response membrane protein n=1 Tax=Mycobacterium sp. TaxID=1785 RepID=UPI002BD67AD9|nr:GlsB/YeaQ/YmgE family stress response membrane protein [Mycobacterium sp.]HXB89301.1 GlsB/YeaQ/YmgE family stress response membrane protein [Mycobacterium sp.]
MVLHIIWMIVLGLVVGLVARLIVPGKQPLGVIATALLGIVGAYVGGTLGSVVFAPHQFTITPPIKHSFLGALVGAVILLLIYQLVRTRTTRRG